MNRYLIAFIAMALAIVGCQKPADKNNANTTISGSLTGGKVTSVTLERFADDLNTTETIATCAVEDGEFEFSIDIANDTPATYYQLNLGEEHTPVRVIVEQGDDISIVVESLGDFYTKYSVNGSDESKLIAEFNDLYYGNADRFVALLEDNTSEAVAIANRAMREQISFVTKNCDKLASVYAIMESFYETFVSLEGITIANIIYVHEALLQSYPTSPYVAVLGRSIELNDMLCNAKESSYFDITLSDINRATHTLSDFHGKVTVLCFWSAYDPYSTPLIAEFKEIYNRLHDKGLEAYFVSVDEIRSNWISVVRHQQHPWASLFGYDNPAVFSAYNIKVTPTIYIIDRKGNIKSGVIDPALLEKDIKRLL